MREEFHEFSEYQKVQAFNTFKGKCFNCGTYHNKMEVDHHMPVDLKGKPVKENCVLLCRSCNRSKSKKHPKRFYSTDKLDALYTLYIVVTPDYNEHLHYEDKRNAWYGDSAKMLGKALTNQHSFMLKDKREYMLEDNRKWFEYEQNEIRKKKNFYEAKTAVQFLCVAVGIGLSLFTIKMGGHDSIDNIMKYRAGIIAERTAKDTILKAQSERRLKVIREAKAKRDEENRIAQVERNKRQADIRNKKWKKENSVNMMPSSGYTFSPKWYEKTGVDRNDPSTW